LWWLVLVHGLVLVEVEWMPGGRLDESIRRADRVAVLPGASKLVDVMVRRLIAGLDFAGVADPTLRDADRLSSRPTSRAALLASSDKDATLMARRAPESLTPISRAAALTPPSGLPSFVPSWDETSFTSVSSIHRAV